MAIEAKRIQFVRGTTAQHANFTGFDGEISIDTDKKVVVAHDGVTAGGSPMAKEATKIISGTPNLIKVNAGTEANLGADITITFDDAQLPQQGANPLDPQDKILYDKAGQTATDLKIEYENGTGKLTLKGHNDVEISQLTLLTADAVLKEAVIGDGPQGNRPNEFLKLTFNKNDGTTTDVWVDLANFITAYTAGDGLELDTQTNEFTAKLGNGLKFDMTGAIELDGQLGGNYTAGDGIQIDQDEIKIALAKDNNLLTIVNGELMSPADYGTLP